MPKIEQLANVIHEFLAEKIDAGTMMFLVDKDGNYYVASQGVNDVVGTQKQLNLLAEALTAAKPKARNVMPVLVPAKLPAVPKKAVAKKIKTPKAS